MQTIKNAYLRLYSFILGKKEESRTARFGSHLFTIFICYHVIRCVMGLLFFIIDRYPNIAFLFANYFGEALDAVVFLGSTVLLVLLAKLLIKVSL